MSKGRRYDQEYKDMIADLYKSGMSLAELSSNALSTPPGEYDRKVETQRN